MQMPILQRNGADWMVMPTLETVLKTKNFCRYTSTNRAYFRILAALYTLDVDRMMGGIVNQDIHVDRSIRLAMPQMVDETDVSLTSASC